MDEWGVVKRGSGGGERGGGQVRPYVIDLESANGTWVNGERVPERRFVEVRSGDVVRFGESERLVGGGFPFSSSSPSSSFCVVDR